VALHAAVIRVLGGVTKPTIAWEGPIAVARPLESPPPKGGLTFKCARYARASLRMAPHFVLRQLNAKAKTRGIT
jgi:hypothetical protein